MSKLSRRTFFALLGGLGGAAAATAVLASCTNNELPPLPDAAPDGPKGCATSNAGCVVLMNHSHAPHVLVVTSADVLAGVDKTYDIMGQANHTHSVTVTAAQFAMLKTGGMVMSTSTATDVLGTLHMHDCTVSCA